VRDYTNCFKSSLLVAFTVMFGKLFIHFQYFVLEFGIFFSFQRWASARLGNDCSDWQEAVLAYLHIREVAPCNAPSSNTMLSRLARKPIR